MGLFALGLVLAVGSGCASQDEMYSIEDRLAYLERRNEQSDRELRSMRSRIEAHDDKLADEGQALSGRAATMRVDIDNLQENIQQINGRLEETLYALRHKVGAVEDAERERQQRIARLEAATAENRTMIERLEEYLNLEKRQTDTAAQPAETPEQAPPDAAGGLPEEQLYQSSRQKFDRGEYEGARIGFAELIKRFPKSAQADNAQFWIGESYYREKWYEKAILEYQKVIENYPKGNKVQASLLKQGFAFHNLGDSANAGLILKELVRKFPDSNEAAIARKKLEGMQ